MFKGLKVLPHTTYLKSKADFREEAILEELNLYHKEISPVFNRTGEYLLGDKCWFEVRGRAFLKRKVDFLYELRQEDMKEVDINVVRGLVKIDEISSKILSKEQKRLISDYGQFLQTRKLKRSSMRYLAKIKKRLEELKKQKHTNRET